MKKTTQQDLIIKKRADVIFEKLQNEPKKNRNKKFAEILWVTEWFACQVINWKRDISERTIIILEDYFSKKEAEARTEYFKWVNY